MTNANRNPVALISDNVRRKAMEAPRALRGYSLIETLIVLALICVLSAIAIPQLISERRLTRSVNVTREMLSQMRLARQMAMSQRQAFTFQYDNAAKQISIIDHNSNLGSAIFDDPGYPNTVNSVKISTTPLGTGGLVSSEITYGIPIGLPMAPLGDGTSMTGLTNNQLNITFQPNGSVINLAGNPTSLAMFIYNNRAPGGTASAISVLGASGRIKIWRYDRSANLYIE